ncbi:MAG TPA: FG-GAP-like repeat-containing protein [Thermoanaerobaculia bacterium]|nr:FG-GAP-like repeat-containing protein [Thermoanaerobaculia bacterium]
MRISTLLLLCSLALSSFAAPSLVRNPKRLITYADGSYSSRGMVIGNFGGDSGPDILTAISGHSFQVLVSDATNGVMGEPWVTPNPQTFASMAVGDLDKDGDADIAVSDYYGTITIYTCNGSGTFSKTTELTTEIYGPQLVIAEFTGDGRGDLAVSAGYPGSLTVFPSNGNGTFGTAIVSTLPTSNSGELMPFDVNLDGKTDLLLRDYYSGMFIGVGNATGAFTFTKITSDWTTGDVAFGDFDKNGTTDFAAVLDSTSDSAIRVYKTASNGTATAFASYGNMRYGCITVADADGDGTLDLLATAASAGGMIAVLHGNGDGSFLQPAIWHTGGASRLAANDFNRDGKIDVVLNNPGSTPALQFVAGTGGGAFDTYRSYNANGTILLGAYDGTRLIGANDMNHDGAPDLVVMVEPAFSVNTQLAVLLNDGTGGMPLTPTTTVDTGSWLTQSFALGDVNNDGHADVVGFGSLYMQGRTWLGRGDGTFQTPVSFPILYEDSGARPSLADVTGDGVVDLLTLREWTPGTATVIYTGNNDGTFTTGAPPSLNEFLAYASGDANGDGKIDFVGQRWNPRVAINKGDGTFTLTSFGENSIETVGGLIDMNEDGFDDLLLSDSSGSVLRLSNGDGTFGARKTFTIDPTFGNEYYALTALEGDFNGDGHTDLAYGPNFYLGNGDTTFRSYAKVLASGNAHDFAVADFDGNGTDDVALQTSAGTVSLLLTNTGPEPAETPTISINTQTLSPRYGTPVTYTAHLETNTARTLTGMVSFARNGVPFALVAPNGFNASASVELPTGNSVISATYMGDDFYAPSNTSSMEQAVTKAATTLSANPTYTGQTPACGMSIPVFVRVQPQPLSLPAPTVDVTFQEGNTSIQAVKLPGSGSYGEATHSLLGLGAGPHVITVDFAGDANYAAATTNFYVSLAAATKPVITATNAVHANGIGYATVALPYDAPVQWTITNGTITQGQGTKRIKYTAGASGQVTLGVSYGNGICGVDGSASVNVPIVTRAAGASMLYLIDTPCRALDTRYGTILGANETRPLNFANVCGIPSDAKAVAVTITTVAPTASGWLSFYPTDLPWPNTSVVSYRTGRTRANNSVVALSPGARATVKNGGPAVHFIIDVAGYFQ